MVTFLILNYQLMNQIKKYVSLNGKTGNFFSRFL